MTTLPWWLVATGRFFRACPEVRGKGRLARLLLSRFLDYTDVELRNKTGEVFLIPHLTEVLGIELLIHGHYEPDTSQFLLKNLQPGGTFVDVGANIGIFTIPAARRVGPAGHVLSIEASQRVFGYLKHNLCRNGIDNVIAQPCAAYDHDEDAISFWQAPADHFGMGALAPQFHANPTKVPARTLDGLLADARIERVDVIKVDVEGFEANVFRGARGLLTGSKSPLILFEFLDWAERRAGQQPGDAQRFLLSLGYRMWRLQDDLSGRPPLETILETGGEMMVARRE